MIPQTQAVQARIACDNTTGVDSVQLRIVGSCESRLFSFSSSSFGNHPLYFNLLVSVVAEADEERAEVDGMQRSDSLRSAVGIECAS